jgi:hypothetical protein
MSAAHGKVSETQAHEKTPVMMTGAFPGADDEARTRDLNLGKVALYQLSYVRTAPDRLPPIGASTSLPDPHEWL